MDLKPFTALLLVLHLTAFSVPSYAASFEQGREAYLAKDYQAALEVLQPLAEQGDASAQIALAIMYENGHGVKLDIPTSLQWYEKAANQGLPIVQHDLGVKYFSGRGIPQDYSKAVYWWTLAAKQGVVESQYNLALMYSRGLGLSKDETEAQHWFRLAAEKGHRQAQYSLAVMYAFGHGLRKNEEKALHWFQQAAEQGMPEAQYNLGMFYETGVGTEASQDRAISWYQKAAAQGLERAAQKLTDLGVEQRPEKPAEPLTPPARNHASNALNGARWIAAQNPDYYTLQLSSGPAESGIIRFLNQYDLGVDSAYFRSVYPSGAVRFTAVYGVFKDLNEAEQALNRLPDALKASKPWIRKFSILHKQVNP